uniref:G-protein coupled receptors family 1 profile domain-containing protein n=1 Tax=Cavia porcellus TaxID=10141 RepID=A0A286Y3U7_CAVPO
MSNQTRVTQFILRGFSDARELRFVVTSFFLFFYLFGLLGTSPLSQLYLEKALVTSLLGSGYISYLECVAQLYVFITLSSTESFLLTAMAYDLCLAILKPLGFPLNWSPMAWVSGAIFSAFHTFNTFSLPFCRPNLVEHFFCDIPSIMRLACADYHLNEEVGFAVSICVVMSSFALTVLSYTWIVSAIVRIPAGEGRWKAFSTCSSHLTTVVLFYGTGIFMYLRLASQYSPTQGRLASIFYSILTPTLNPVIYCLRDRDMKVALQKLFC